jgi:hypothetical protein
MSLDVGSPLRLSSVALAKEDRRTVFPYETWPGGKPLDGFDKLTAGMLGALSLSKRRRPYTRFGDRQHHSRNTVRLHESSQAPEDQAEPQSNPIHSPGSIGGLALRKPSSP